MVRFKELKKIDGHMHFHAGRNAILKKGDRYGFSFITINTEAPSFPSIETQQKISLNFSQSRYANLNHVSTISTEHIDQNDWAVEAIKQIEQRIEAGALGIKFWKNIGMAIQRPDGSFIMLDDDELAPVFTYMEQEQIPVLGHQGEPKNCWLPLDEMTVKSDREYFAAHPEYHMYQSDDFPGYWTHIKARDHVLDRYPALPFIGAHMGSLEWNLDEIAKRLEQYPNFAIDLSERFSHLYLQAARNRQKVIDFFTRWQDRIIYGTDIIDDPDTNAETITDELERRWKKHWTFLSTDERMQSTQIDKSFQGLALSKNILEKIYYSNALNWYNI